MACIIERCIQYIWQIFIKVLVGLFTWQSHLCASSNKTEVRSRNDDEQKDDDVFLLKQVLPKLHILQLEKGNKLQYLAKYRSAFKITIILYFDTRILIILYSPLVKSRISIKLWNSTIYHCQCHNATGAKKLLNAEKMLFYLR